MITRLIQILQPHSGKLLTLWFVSVVFLSVVPTPGSINSIDIGKIEIRLDYLYHIIIYATGPFLALIYYCQVKTPVSTTSLRHYVVISIIIVSLSCFSVLQEFIQKLIPYRTFNINDIISNLMGVFAGSAITLWAMRERC